MKLFFLKRYAIGYLFFITIGIEFFFFRFAVMKEIEGYYPEGFDQASFLIQIYQTYANIQQLGFINALQQAPGLATGPLFNLQAIVFVWLFGASRFTLLLINFIYFVGLQFFTLIALRSISKQYRTTLFLWGLMVGLLSLSNKLGGMIDFRMDFIAFSLYGIITACVVKSQAFYDTKWSFITLFFMLVLIPMRGITSIYLIGATGLFLVFFLFQFLKNTSFDKTTRIRKQLCHVSIIFFIVMMGAAFYIFLNRSVLMDYYGVNHFLGKEKAIRSILENVTNPIVAFFYYPLSLIKRHVGPYDVLAIVGMLAITGFARHLPKRVTPVSISLFKFDSFICLIILFVTPILILSFDNLKSPVVVGILICPFLWLMSWPIIWSHQYIFSKNTTAFFNVFSIGVFSLGLFFYCFQMSINKHNRMYYLDALTIKKMNIDIGDYATRKHWPMINMSIDGIYPGICSGSLIAQYFEAKQVALKAGPQKMGGTIFPITLKEAINSIKLSNLAIITPDKLSNSPYPLTSSIQPLKPRLLQEIKKNFILLNTYYIAGHPYQVYVRIQ